MSLHDAAADTDAAKADGRQAAATSRRYRLDATTRVVGADGTLLGGSPLRLFRLSPAGRQAFDEIAAGEPVAASSLTRRLLDSGAIHPVPGRPVQHSPADVTVVVPAHDTPGERLEQLRSHTVGSAGLIVVDDGSGTPLSGFRGASVLRLRHNSGPAAARNAGARAAETALIAFVDTDVELHDGWLDGLLGHFDDPGVGFVAPRVASGAAAVGGAGVARYERRHSPLDLGSEPARVAPGTRVAYVPGAALVVRAAALDAVGGFDPGLRSGEDVDLVWRLCAAGWRGRYEPAVIVEHRPRPTWRALFLQRRTYGESAAALAVTYGDAVAPVRISPWTLGAWALAASGRLAGGVLVAAGTAFALVPKLPGVPAVDSLRLAGTGHAMAGLSLASAARRTWWPLLGLGALGSRRVRRLAAAAVVPGLLDGGPARLFDDVAYGTGVWRGVVARRRIAPLLPALTRWPRRDDVEPVPVP